MEALTSILFHGLAYAMILYVVSVGLSVTMGLMGFVNLAHGVFAMAGGYVTVTLMNSYAVPFAVALLAAFILIALISVVLERTLYARLYGASELDQVLFTIGLIFMSVAIVRYLWGPLPQPVHLPVSLSGQLDLGFRTFPMYRSFLIAVGFILIALLWLGIERTNVGAQLRAAVDNRRMAESIGIDTRRLFSFAFALGSGLRHLAVVSALTSWRSILATPPSISSIFSWSWPSAAWARYAAHSLPHCCWVSVIPPANIWCLNWALSSCSLP